MTINICSKQKDDNTPWNKIIPYIEPEGLPLFNVGKLDEITEKKIKNDENERRNEKINVMKEITEQINEFNELMEVDQDADIEEYEDTN